jgi:hypothetical protein
VTEIGHDAFLRLNIESVKLPTTLEKIGYEAFYKCTKLKSVEINSEIKIIETRAFQDCTALSTINLPEGLERIESGAFQSCSSLTSINIPATVTYIGDAAFNRSGVKNIYFNGTNTAWKNITKDGDFWSPSGNYYVHCTDGIYLNGHTKQ